jgi:hypothetical protein
MEMQGNNVINFVAHLQFQDSTLAIHIEELREPTLRQKKKKQQKEEASEPLMIGVVSTTRLLRRLIRRDTHHRTAAARGRVHHQTANGIAATVGHQPALIKGRSAQRISMAMSRYCLPFCLRTR